MTKKSNPGDSPGALHDKATCLTRSNVKACSGLVHAAREFIVLERLILSMLMESLRWRLQSCKSVLRMNSAGEKPSTGMSIQPTKSFTSFEMAHLPDP